MIVLNILNFIGLSILKIIIVSLLFISMGFSLVFMMAMEVLTKALQILNDNVN
jgi:ammonia channel protein AmtB